MEDEEQSRRRYTQIYPFSVPSSLWSPPLSPQILQVASDATGCLTYQHILGEDRAVIAFNKAPGSNTRLLLQVDFYDIFCCLAVCSSCSIFNSLTDFGHERLLGLISFQCFCIQSEGPKIDQNICLYWNNMHETRLKINNKQSAAIFYTYISTILGPPFETFFFFFF